MHTLLPRTANILMTLLLLFTGALITQPIFAQSPSNHLRDLAAQQNRLFGFAVGWGAVADPAQAPIIQAEANILSSENNFKWFCLQPQPGVFVWDQNDPYNCSSADADVDFALANGMEFHGHTLVWHEGLPQWVKELPTSQLEQTMYDHIDMVVGRYAGQVHIWDVVNEAVKSVCDTAGSCGYRDQSTGQENLDSIWYGSVGPDPHSYIVKAFQRTRQADPSAILLYNDFGIETINPKSDFLYAEVQRWLNEGAPIDAIGVQGHIGVDFSEFQSFANNMARFAALGLDIYITELDVSVQNSTQYTQQAEVYRQVIEACLNEPQCRGIQTWGWTDRFSWLNNVPWAAPHVNPLLFNECFQPKPAYRAVQEALGGQPDTFILLQAEDYGAQNNSCTSAGQPGVCRGDEADPAEFIYNVDAGDWIKFDDIDFGSGFSTLRSCYAKGADNNGRVEVRLDSTTGPIIAGFGTDNTGDWNNFQISESPLIQATGVNTLYFVFTGDSGVGNFDDFLLVVNRQDVRPMMSETLDGVAYDPTSTNYASLGELLVNFRFTYSSGPPLNFLQFVVNKADNAVVVNTDDGAGGVDSTITILNSSLPGADGKFQAGEALIVQFVIGIEASPWSVNFDMFGSDGEPVSAANNETLHRFSIDSATAANFLQNRQQDFQRKILLPLIY